MENISQKDINAILHTLRTFSNGELADKLEKIDVIGALYVVNYLKVLNQLREKTRVPDTSSEISKKHNFTKDDFKGFKEELKKNYHLELHYLIDTPEQFEGMMHLLYHALEREHLICDFDDGVHPKTKIGKCQNEDHYDICDADPVDEELTLTYSYSEDNHKMDKQDPYYHCKKCQADINENAEGYVACDTELSE